MPTSREGPIDQRATAYLRTTMPFTELMGVEAIVALPEDVHLRLPWQEKLCTAGGILHGGALMALADSAGGWCAFLNLPPGAGTTTIESKTNLLRSTSAGHVDALARPLHVGQTTIVVDTVIHDAQHRLVCRTTQTQLVQGLQ